MIASDYLNELTTYTNMKIAKVVLNDTLAITDWLIKSTEDNMLMIEYMVQNGSIETVTSVELRASDDSVISSRTVNVPILEDTILRHVITIEEVA